MKYFASKRLIAVSLILSVLLGFSTTGIYAASTLENYNFNSDADGETPSYVDGDAVVSTKWLDASNGKAAAFSMPQDAARTRFKAKVKAAETFILRLFDGDDFEEIRITPKSSAAGMLYVVLDDGNMSVVFANEQIEHRKSHILTDLTKVQIENARIDNVHIGDMDIAAMPVNLHMYLYNDAVNLGYVEFAPDGGSMKEIYASWYTDDGSGELTDYGTGESREIPDSEYIGCGVLYGTSLISIPAKRVSDLDVLIFDYPVTTEFDSSEGKQVGITLKNASGSSWTSTPAQTDWSEYDELVLRAMSREATDRVYQTNIYSSSSGSRGYFFNFFTVNWGGRTQKDIVLPIGQESSSDASSAADTWENITGAALETTLSTQQSEEGTLTDTEQNTSVSYSGVFLRKREPLAQFNNQEYILNAQKRTDDAPDYAQSIIEKGHPRIYLTPERIEELKEDVVNDDYLKMTYELLQKNVAESMENAVMQGESGRASEIAQAALLYNLSPDEELKQWIEVSTDALIASERNEWNYNSSSFLQVGDTMRAMALVYDWMYSHWDAERNLKMRNAIMHCGIEPTIRTLRAGKRWAGEGQGNWNHAILSGIGMGLLAICDNDYYSELTNELMERVIHSLFYGQRDFDENGAYTEGVAYWHYAMDTFIPFEAALSQICGDNYGLLDAPKMKVTGYFPIYMTGAQGIFSFADAYYPSNIRSAAFYRLSEYFGDPVIGSYQYAKSYNEGGGDYLSLLFYDKNGGYIEDYTQYLPEKYKYYPGDTESFALIPKSHTYLAFKGGQNGISHSQLDIGTFVYDINNVRWICDLGRDSYQDYNNKSKYYRNRAEGNNCIVINPDEDVDQITDARAQITEHKVVDTAGYGIIDMSAAYEDATSVKRGFMMTDDFETLVIQDEITADSALPEVYSFMHTHQDVELSSDGKSAVLTCNESNKTERKVYVKLLSNCGAELCVMDAQLMKLTPAEEQYSNARYKKLAVKAEDAENPTFTVVISTSENPSVTEITPLNEWAENPLFQD